MYNSAKKAYSSYHLPPPAHHFYSLVPIKYTEKTGWMIIEKLISKWHASVALVLHQMGILRAMLIHPGKLTGTLHLRSCGKSSGT